jgi:signal transduction histidine kinase
VPKRAGAAADNPHAGAPTASVSPPFDAWSASTMNRRPETDWDRIVRRGWVLWGVTLAVVLALTAAIPMLYLPLLQATLPEGRRAVDEAYPLVIGLSGLVVIFCLYTVLKQRELNRTQRALQRQEQDQEAVRTRLSELSALFQVSTTLHMQLRLEIILEIIVRRVVSTLRAQQASVMIHNPESGMLETRASYGLESEFARNARARMGEGIAGWVAERQEAVLLTEKPAAGELGRHFKPNRNITSAISLPLRVGERCVGVLNVNRINHPEPFEEHHRELLQLFAEHVGAIIDRAETLERLGTRNRELEADLQRIHEDNRLKDVFLATVSHELRTPLGSVLAYADLLDDQEGRLDPAQRGEFLARLRSEAGRLRALIDDILDLSRLEGGRMVLKRGNVGPGELARSAVRTSAALVSRRDVVLSEDYAANLPVLQLDEVRMRQVMVNLLENAITFSPEHGHVSVRVMQDGAFVRLEVRDEGPGVPPEDAPTIFDLFAQGVKGSGGRGGLGVGLHLVKRITELHGGHVGVNSLPGEGSTFWIRLPLALSAEEPHAPAPDGSRAAA